MLPYIAAPWILWAMPNEEVTASLNEMNTPTRPARGLAAMLRAKISTRQVNTASHGRRGMD